uniref:Reverse transcriptase Ty1/copia-type domain-containing protein n=1 Tax=Tanacetum cinerariifolium TaxID=118510 RepID=A0A6L2K6X2_TANCI|nr:hypothetical protein [Tanacetum cinerariifolium]
MRLEGCDSWDRAQGNMGCWGKSIGTVQVEPITTENKANKTVGLKEANNSTGTQDNLDAGNSKMEAEHVPEYFVLPLCSSYTSTVKCSKAKNRDEKLNEDTVSNDGIFTSASYNAEGAVADFTNLESSMNVSPIPQSRIHSIHPTTYILGDPNSAVQTRSKVNKSLGAHAFVYKNKKDERGIVVRNKARLVAQGHRQEERIDYDEVFAYVARIEAIRIFLAFASYMGFKVYQMDVKSALLYGKVNEEVYVSQPPGFIDPKFPKKVYKVIKALYGLHQAPRAWFKMSSMGELTFFLRLQVKQRKDGIFISQDKFIAEILKKFDFMSMKTLSTPIETKKPLVKDVKATDVTPKTSHLYVVKRIFRKSTTGGCQFLGNFNKLDDLVGEGIDYAVNKGRSTDKIKVLNAEAKGVSAAGETLSTATLAVSTVSVQPVLVLLKLLCLIGSKDR